MLVVVVGVLTNVCVSLYVQLHHPVLPHFVTLLVTSMKRNPYRQILRRKLQTFPAHFLFH